MFSVTKKAQLAKNSSAKLNSQSVLKFMLDRTSVLSSAQKFLSLVFVSGFVFCAAQAQSNGKNYVGTYQNGFGECSVQVELGETVTVRSHGNAMYLRSTALKLADEDRVADFKSKGIIGDLGQNKVYFGEIVGTDLTTFVVLVTNTSAADSASTLSLVNIPENGVVTTRSCVGLQAIDVQSAESAL